MPPQSDATHDPIVITGCGWVTPPAAGTAETVLAAARAADLSALVVDGYCPVPATQVKSAAGLSGELKRDKGAALAAIALQHACETAQTAPENFDPLRTGLVLGCAAAGQLGMIGFAEEVRKQTPRFVSPLHFPQTVGNYVAGALARNFQLRGPNLTIASGSASGLDALADACTLLNDHSADLVFAAATLELSPALANGWANDGVNGGATGDVPPAEGACVLALERMSTARTRGARILATIRDVSRLTTAAAQAIVPPTAALFIADAPTRPGSFAFDRWVGRCEGVNALAGVAVALGIAGAPDVAQAWADLASEIAGAAPPIAAVRDADANFPARILAHTDTHATCVELTVAREL